MAPLPTLTRAPKAVLLFLWCVSVAQLFIQEVDSATSTTIVKDEDNATCRVLNLQPRDYPSIIRLRAGVIHAPPFAEAEEDSDGNPSFRGFQMDLLERLKVFAAADDVTLQVELSRAPNLYVDAFDLVANDCHSISKWTREDCERYDLIVGDYYSNPERYMRADLSPPWLKTTITTIKHLEKEEGKQDYTTLKQAEDARATVCLPEGTYILKVIEATFPANNYLHCSMIEGDECLTLLKSGNCVLLAMDELLLHWRASMDPSLEVTREALNSQFIVWPMREALPPVTHKLFKKWLYSAVRNATLDELYFRYFQKELCPLGTAGENCQLPCDPKHGAADRYGACICKSPKWTGEDCSIEVMEETNLLPSSLLVVAYVLVGTTFASVTVCGAWVVYNWKRSLVRMAQPLFLLMILVGCIISTSTIIVLVHQDDGSGGSAPKCMAIPWLYSVGFCITFGAMFSRIRRIYGLLQSALEMRRVVITAKDTFFSIGLVLGIDVTILIVWSSVDPLTWKRRVTSADQFGNPLESEGFCHSDHWKIFTSVIASFHLFLMGVACYMCYVARRIPENLSNGKYVAIAMFSNLQILIIALPVLIVLGSDPQATFVVRVLAIWINDFVVILVIFGSLIYNVSLRDTKRKQLGRRASAQVVGDDILDYASRHSMHSRANLQSEASGGGHSEHRYPTTEASGHQDPPSSSIMDLFEHSDDSLSKSQEHDTSAEQTSVAFQNGRETADKEKEEGGSVNNGSAIEGAQQGDPTVDTMLPET